MGRPVKSAVTGPPAEVGLGFKPPIYLELGDQVEPGVDDLGVSKTLVAYDPSQAAVERTGPSEINLGHPPLQISAGCANAIGVTTIDEYK